MNKYHFSILFIFLFNQSQICAQKFYVNTVSTTGIVNKTYNLNADSCDIISDSTNLPIFTCTGSGQFYTDMAVDDTNLWYVTSQGKLYSRKINDTTSCKYVGAFENGLVTVTALISDTIGNIYAGGRIGDTNIIFRYHNNTFSRVGNLPQWATPLGDLFFYQNRLFLTCNNGTTGNNFILEVDSITKQSCFFMPLSKFNAFGAFTIRPKEGKEEVFLLGTQDGTLTPSYLVEIDMIGKTIKDTLCTYPFTTSGASSYYPAIWDSSTCPPVSVTNKSSYKHELVSVLSPCKDIIRIISTIDNASIEYLRLYDTFGRKLKSYNNSDFPNNLSISDIPDGIYILYIRSIDGLNESYKVVKANY
ncbi:MAG: T9SS type A sorting domain-containing protein [Chitinophagales bacterium]|nr:T9SS type A sorting domain-containing protein [Chitinophagales bacterium]